MYVLWECPAYSNCRLTFWRSFRRQTNYKVDYRTDTKRRYTQEVDPRVIHYSKRYTCQYCTRSCFSCGTCTCMKQINYGDFVVKIIAMWIFVCQFLLAGYINMQLPFNWCVVYIIAAFTNKINMTTMLSQCCNIVVDPILPTSRSQTGG